MIGRLRPMPLARWLERTRGIRKPKPGTSLLEGEGKPSPASIEIPIELAATCQPSEWVTAAASVVGSSHAKQGLGCDDWFEVRQDEGVLVVVAADGMGSARFGAIGARIAAKAATSALVSKGLAGATIAQVRSHIRLAIGVAQESIAQIMEELSCNSRELATTLIVVVADKHYLAIGHIGDGAVLALTETGEAVTVAMPQKGQYANETAALGTTDELLFTTVLNKRIQALAVMTDGLERIAINQGMPYLPFMEPLWQFLRDEEGNLHEKLAEFLKSDRLQRATDDDCTLVLACLRSVQEES